MTKYYSGFLHRDYIALGHPDKFLINLLLPTAITLVLTPVLQGRSPTSVNIEAALALTAILLLIAGSAMYYLWRRTYSPTLHRRRSIAISFLIYFLMASVMSLVLFYLTVAIVIFGAPGNQFPDPGAQIALIALSASVFTLVLISSMGREVVLRTYDRNDELERKATRFIKLIGLIQELDDNEDLSSDQLEQEGFSGMADFYDEVLNMAEYIEEIIKVGAMEDEKQLHKDLSCWTRRFVRQNSSTTKRVLITGKQSNSANPSEELIGVHDHLKSSCCGLSAIIV